MEVLARQISGDLVMMWFFSRDRESLKVEMRYDSVRREFFLSVCGPKKDRHERFGDLAGCRLRLVALEIELESERWLRARQGRYETRASGRAMA